jgi:hypothetical protein
LPTGGSDYPAAPCQRFADGRFIQAMGVEDDRRDPAHELNNLLQVMLGLVPVIRRRAARGDDVGQYLDELEQAVSRLRAVLRR